MNYKLVFIPLIAAFTGWFTTWIAIKMLFHPRKPFRFLGLRIQGIFPKNQEQIAEKLGEVVHNELLSFNEIEEKVSNPHNFQKLKPEIDKHIDNFLRTRIPDTFPLLSIFIGDKTIHQLKAAFLAEFETLFPVLMKSYMHKLESELDLKMIVKEKVAGFSGEKLEDMLNKITKKEFRFLEVIGAVFGFLIGMVQLLITVAGK
jgi:uncharacterized membrane protein YheB (UPF0754 family)